MGSVGPSAAAATTMELATSRALIALAASLTIAAATEIVNATQLNIEQNSGLKNYQEEEDGKVLPYRTFLNTVEIVVICVFTVLFVILMTLLTIYLCLYGCVLPKCCRRTSKEYTEVQLHRERKI